MGQLPASVAPRRGLLVRSRRTARAQGGVTLFCAACRIGIGIVFVWSALPKLREPFSFLTAVYNYELVGPAPGLLVSLVLPWLELLVGLALIGDVFVGGAMLMTVLLSSVFVYAQCSALRRGLDIPCGCFGNVAEGSIETTSLFRTAGIWVASLLAFGAFALAPSGGTAPSGEVNPRPSSDAPGPVVTRQRTGSAADKG